MEVDIGEVYKRLGKPKENGQVVLLAPQEAIALYKMMTAITLILIFLGMATITLMIWISVILLH